MRSIPFIWVFGGDTGSNAVPINRCVVCLHEIDGAGAVGIGKAIEASNLRDVVEGNAHGHLQLCRWDVDTGELLSDGMLNLLRGEIWGGGRDQRKRLKAKPGFSLTRGVRGGRFGTKPRY